MTDLFAALQSAANSGASGINGYAPPTAAQAKAGTYKKGRVRLHGLDIAIETPQGQRRVGKEDGKPWSVICMAHYGDISGSIGADGDPVDVYVGPVPESSRVYVVNQTNKDGGFDEHKVLMGFLDEDAARTAYLGSYERGWNRFESIVSASVDQFKWWLKYGNTTKPFTKNALPYSAEDDMSDIQWDSAAMPANTDLGSILYSLRRSADADLLLDAVSMQDVLEDADGMDIMDALVVESQKLGLKMEQMRRIMESAGDTVKPISMQVSDPFRQKGTTNVTALFELSDGQTVAIFFHNPDSTPNRILPQDELVSWKWLLNKMDITILVAPEKGRDLNPREVSRRVMRLAEKNSARFQKANSSRAERLAAVEQGRTDVSIKEGTLAGLDTEIAELTEKLAAKRSIQAPAPDAPLGTSATEEQLGMGQEKSFSEIARSAIPAEFETKDNAGDDITAIAVDGFGMRFRLYPTAVAVTVFQPGVEGQEALTSNTTSVGLEPAITVSVENAMMFIGQKRAALAEAQEQNSPEATEGEPAEPVVPVAADDSEVVAEAVAAARQGAGGITKLATSEHFTFGDDILFSDELRAKVEAELGEPLVEHVFEGNELETALVPKSMLVNVENAQGLLSDVERAAILKQVETDLSIIRDQPNSPGVEYRRSYIKTIFATAQERDVEFHAMLLEKFPDALQLADVEQLPAAESDDQSSEARALLQSVIDGTADLSDLTLVDRLEAIHAQYEADAEMMALFDQAANAYSAAIIAQARPFIEP